MDKKDLLLPVMINEIAYKSNVSLEVLMQDGLIIVNDFRADPANRSAIAEVYQKANNPNDINYKLSKFGEQQSMRLFMNNVITIFQLQRDLLYPKMPEDIGLEFHREITKFYMTYSLAAISALQLRLIDMARVSVAMGEMRDHFFDYLSKYVMYM